MVDCCYRKQTHWEEQLERLWWVVVKAVTAWYTSGGWTGGRSDSYLWCDELMCGVVRGSCWTVVVPGPPPPPPPCPLLPILTVHSWRSTSWRSRSPSFGDHSSCRWFYQTIHSSPHRSSTPTSDHLQQTTQWSSFYFYSVYSMHAVL